MGEKHQLTPVNLDKNFLSKSSESATLTITAFNDKSDILNSSKQIEVYHITGSAYPLPENWPKIPQWKDHHWISELTNCKTPSVKRAVSHIQLIQNVLDKWFLRVAEEVKSTTCNSYPAPQKQLTFHPLTEEKSTLEHDETSLALKPLSSTTNVMSTPRGWSFMSDDMLLMTSAEHMHGGNFTETDLEVVPYLGAQKVIDEVITLIAELENDRRETQEMYIKEIKRGEWLRSQIDELQMHHLKLLPALVQREHEACIMDLTELNWHVVYTKRVLEKTQHRFSVLTRQNIRLKENIDFVNKHVPLVQEKMVLEVEFMDKIRKAQGHADQELMVAQQVQAKTEMRSKEEISKANTEKEHMKKELESTREALKNIKECLDEAQNTYRNYEKQMNEIHLTLIDNVREMEVLKLENEKARISEEKQAKKVRNLQAKVTQGAFDNSLIENKNLELEQELDKNKDNHTNKLQELEEQRKTLEVQQQKLARENMERSLDVQDYEKKISVCDKQNTAVVKNITRINRDIESTTLVLEQTIDSHLHASNLHNHLQDQLHSEKDKTSSAEEKIKKTAETLRRKIQEEIHTKKVLAARIKSVLAETVQVQSEAAQKKEKAKNVMEDLEGAISVVLKKVNKLQETEAEMLRQKESLNTKIKETKQQHKDSSDRFQRTLEVVEPQHQTVKGELKTLNDQLQTMTEQTLMMKNKMEEMDAAQIMMARSVKRIDQEVEILSAEMNELNLQIEAGRKLEQDLHRQYHDTLDRLRSSEKKHSDLQEDRQAVLRQQETDKTHLMLKNKELASKYRQLQKNYLLQKELMLRSYDERVSFEADIIDVKQLKSLQSRLHEALVGYFKLRSLTSETELNMLEEESRDNSIRVHELRVKMENALSDIAQFLNRQKDGRQTKQFTRGKSTKTQDSSSLQMESGLTTADVNLGIKVGPH